MKITCPQCAFEREINTDKIPAKSTVATCPKCSAKFTFRSFAPSVEELDEIKQEIKAQDIQSSPNEVQTENIEKAAQTENIEQGDAIEKAEAEKTEQEQEKAEENQSEKKAFAEEKEEVKEEKKEEDLSDEEERVRKAHEFYREQMNKIKELEKEGYTVQLLTMVPWEDAQSKSNVIDKFVQTVVRSLFASPAFFSTMFRPFPISKAVLFYILIGVIQFVARMLTFRFNSDPNVVIDDPNMQLLVETLLEPSTLVLGLFIAPFVLILQLMFVSAVLHFIVKLVEPKSADFSLIVRIICYASAPGLLSLVPVLGDLLSMPWILFNIVIACRCALNISLPKTILTIFALILFIMLALLIALSAI